MKKYRSRHDGRRYQDWRKRWGQRDWHKKKGPEKKKLPPEEDF